jgi:hypothetical protein
MDVKIQIHIKVSTLILEDAGVIKWTANIQGEDVLEEFQKAPSVQKTVSIEDISTSHSHIARVEDFMQNRKVYK